VPLSRGELGPHLTQCGVGRGLLRAKWRLHLSSCLATIDMGRKLGAVAFGEELRPHLTQRRLGRGLPPYQVASRSIQQWVGLYPFILGRSWVPSKYKIAWAEAYLHTKWHLSPSSRLATTDIGRKFGVCPFGGAATPSNTTLPGPRFTCVPSGILIQPGEGCALFSGELGPHRTQSRVGRGLPPYQVAF